MELDMYGYLNIPIDYLCNNVFFSLKKEILFYVK